MNLDRYVKTLRVYAGKADFTVTPYGAIGDDTLFVLTRSGGPPEAAHFYLSAGVHGDEPAGCLAVLELLRRDCLPREVSWTVLPTVNPSGLRQRTRHNANDVDVNRDYGPRPVTAEARLHLVWLRDRQFSAAFCLHEDYETDGAYLYELKAEAEPSLSRPILAAMRPWVGIETRPEIDEMPNEDGLMRPPAEVRSPDREDLPEALRLFHAHTARCYTFETPSRANITARIGAQIAAVEAATRAWRDAYGA